MQILTTSRALAIALASVVGLPAAATTLSVTTDVSTAGDIFGPDIRFSEECGGADSFGCEFAVAEARAGNRAPNGNSEAAIFNRIDNSATSGQVSTGVDLSVEQAFALSYTASTTTLSWSVYGRTLTDSLDFGALAGGDNPDAVAETLVIRTRQAEVNDLVLNGMGLPTLSTLNSGTRGYLYISGIDFTADFLLTGDVLLGAGNNAAAAMQIKVTDLEAPAPVPLPANAWLML